MLTVTRSGLGLLFIRVRRYIGTLFWLVRQQWTSAPWLLVGSLASGLLSRFGNILSLFVTIKCAIWLLHPNGPPEQVKTLVESSLGEQAIPFALLAVPIALVLLVSLGEVLYGHLSRHLKMRTCLAISQSTVEQELSPSLASEITPRHAAEKGRYAAKRFKDIYDIAFRMQSTMITLIVAGVTVILSSLLGLALDPALMSLILALATTLSLIFIWRRHAAFHVVTEEQSAANKQWQAARIDFAQGVSELLQKPATVSAHDAPRLETLISVFEPSISASHRSRDVFRGTTNSIASIGQGVMLAAFLIIVFFRGAETDVTHLATMAIIVLLLRFIVAQFRTITNQAIALSKDYPFLVEIRQISSASAAPPKAV